MDMLLLRRIRRVSYPCGDCPGAIGRPRIGFLLAIVCKTRRVNSQEDHPLTAMIDKPPIEVRDPQADGRGQWP